MKRTESEGVSSGSPSKADGDDAEYKPEESSDSDDDHIGDAHLLDEELAMRQEREREETRKEAEAREEEARRPITREERRSKLETLIKRAEMFTEFLKEQLAEARKKAEDGGLQEMIKDKGPDAPAAPAPGPAPGPAPAPPAPEPKKGGKRGRPASKGPSGAPPPKKGSAAIDLGTEEEQMALQRQLCPMITGGALKDYQLKGVAWLMSLHINGINGILADQMGLGKTCQTISFLSTLYQEMNGGPFLIVGPLSTLPNWINEIKRWAPTLPCVLYHGTPDERRDLREGPMALKKNGKTSIGFPVVVTSFEVVMRDRPHLSRYAWKYLVVDEGHRLKNKDCRLLADLSTLGPRDGKLLLTGTPLQNNLQELWSLLHFILPDVFSSFSDFSEWFDFSTVLQGGDSTDDAAVQQAKVVAQLQRVLRPFLLRRIKTDVLSSLPPKREIVLYAPPTPDQDKMAAGIKDRSLMAELDKLRREGALAVASRSTLNNRLMQLRKVANHPDLVTSQIENSALYPPLEDIKAQCGKVQVLDRLLEHLFRGGHKVLIFSQMARMLDLLDYYLAERFGAEGVGVRKLDGSVPWLDRQRSIDEFNNDPDVKCFLLSTRAGGLGINLTAADTVIIYDSDWNPHMDFQAMDRCHRIGQTRPVLVFRLATSHSVEVKMLQKANSKLMLERLVVKKQDIKFGGEGGGKKVGPGAVESEDFYAEAPRKLTDAEIAELLQADYRHDDECQGAAVSDKQLGLLLDREHMARGTPCPYPLRGPGFEVVERAAAGLLQSVE